MTTSTAPAADTAAPPVNLDLETKEAPAPTTTASDAVRALESAWADIQEHHPDLPKVYFTVGSGREGRRQAINGHWAASRWQPRGEGAEELGEVFMAGERMEQGGEAVMETLLHESAHGLNHARGVKDTSQNGAYHNGKFKKAAEEVMLSCEKGKKGHNLTDHTDGSRARYADTIAMLDGALKHYRVGPSKDSDGEKKSRTARVKMECECTGDAARSFLMVPTQVMRGFIECTVCDHTFANKDGKLAAWWEEQEDKGATADMIVAGGPDDFSREKRDDEEDEG